MQWYRKVNPVRGGECYLAALRDEHSGEDNRTMQKPKSESGRKSA